MNTTIFRFNLCIIVISLDCHRWRQEKPWKSWVFSEFHYCCISHYLYVPICCPELMFSWVCVCGLCRGARLCCWSTLLGASPAPSQSALTLTSHPSTTCSWKAAMAATSSTSPRELVPRSTSLTPTASRRNPQSTFKAQLSRSAWHGNIWWCVTCPCCICVESFLTVL